MSNETQDKPPLHVIRLETVNAMGVRAVTIEPDPADPLIVVGGDNGAGKTSTIDSIWWAIGGKPNAKMPIRKGEAEAHIRLDLGDLIVTRRFRYGTDGKVVSDLKVSTRDGANYSRPQQVLDNLVSKFAFDPGEFVRLRDSEQIAAVKRALRLDTEDLDAREAELVDRRRQLKDGLERLRIRNAGLPSFPDAPDEEVDVSELTREMEAAAAENRRVDGLKRDAQDKAKNLQTADEWIASQERKVEDVRRGGERAAAEIEAEIERLQRRLAEVRAESARVLEAETTTLAEWREKRGRKEAEAIAAQKIAEATAYVDTEDLRRRIAEAGEVNRQVLQNRRLAEAIAEWDEWENERVDVETAIEIVRAERRVRTVDAVTDARLAVDGLEIRDGALWLDGVPFAQCNTEKQLRLSVALAVKENPRLRVFRIADGEKITPRNMEVLRAIAREANAQIWMECAVTPEDVAKGFREVSVLIEDGANVEAPQRELEGVKA